jgi:enoyl-CoA hydratase/carnithine racemase
LEENQIKGLHANFLNFKRGGFIMAYTYKCVLCEKGEGVLKITMNQPETLNALTPELEKDLHEALYEGDADSEVFCMVICGAGRGFCSGYNIGIVPGKKGTMTDPAIYDSIGEYLATVQVHDYQNIQHRQLDIWRLKKPVIAAVHGYCMGGGLWLAMACDMCYCVEESVFGQPEVRHNSNSTFLIPALAGWQRAARYLYTGDHFDGKEAERIGIVNQCVANDQLMPTVMALAERIAMVPPNSVRIMKRLIMSGFMAYGIGAAMEVCAPYSTLAHSSHGPERQAMFDAQKDRGMKGYLEVRDGKFLPEPFGPKSKIKK